jgi:hypothetical protein
MRLWITLLFFMFVCFFIFHHTRVWTQGFIPLCQVFMFFFFGLVFSFFQYWKLNSRPAASLPLELCPWTFCLYFVFEIGLTVMSQAWSFVDACLPPSSPFFQQSFLLFIWPLPLPTHEIPGAPPLVQEELHRPGLHDNQHVTFLLPHHWFQGEQELETS